MSNNKDLNIGNNLYFLSLKEEIMCRNIKFGTSIEEQIEILKQTILEFLGCYRIPNIHEFLIKIYNDEELNPMFTQLNLTKEVMDDIYVTYIINKFPTHAFDEILGFLRRDLNITIINYNSESYPKLNTALTNEEEQEIQGMSKEEQNQFEEENKQLNDEDELSYFISSLIKPYHVVVNKNIRTLFNILSEIEISLSKSGKGFSGYKPNALFGTINSEVDGLNSEVVTAKIENPETLLAFINLSVTNRHEFLKVLEKHVQGLYTNK